MLTLISVILALYLVIETFIGKFNEKVRILFERFKMAQFTIFQFLLGFCQSALYRRPGSSISWRLLKTGRMSRKTLWICCLHVIA